MLKLVLEREQSLLQRAKMLLLISGVGVDHHVEMLVGVVNVDCGRLRHPALVVQIHQTLQSELVEVYLLR